MANSDVEKLKTDLQQCEDELVDMRKMHEKLLNLIASAEGIKLKETDGKECVFQWLLNEQLSLNLVFGS